MNHWNIKSVSRYISAFWERFKVRTIINIYDSLLRRDQSLKWNLKYPSNTWFVMNHKELAKF